jgi:excinuclease ABC subunit C
MPDILLIDGGKGQLSSASEVMQELGVTNVLLLGVAKGVDRKPG